MAAPDDVPAFGDPARNPGADSRLLAGLAAPRKADDGIARRSGAQERVLLISCCHRRSCAGCVSRRRRTPPFQTETVGPKAARQSSTRTACTCRTHSATRNCRKSPAANLLPLLPLRRRAAAIPRLRPAAISRRTRLLPNLRTMAACDSKTSSLIREAAVRA